MIYHFDDNLILNEIRQVNKSQKEIVLDSYLKIMNHYKKNKLSHVVETKLIKTIIFTIIRDNMKSVNMFSKNNHDNISLDLFLLIGLNRVNVNYLSLRTEDLVFKLLVQTKEKNKKIQKQVALSMIMNSLPSDIRDSVIISKKQKIINNLSDYVLEEFTNSSSNLNSSTEVTNVTTGVTTGVTSSLNNSNLSTPNTTVTETPVITTPKPTKNKTKYTRNPNYCYDDNNNNNNNNNNNKYDLDEYDVYSENDKECKYKKKENVLYAQYVDKCPTILKSIDDKTYYYDEYSGSMTEIDLNNLGNKLLPLDKKELLLKRYNLTEQQIQDLLSKNDSVEEEEVEENNNNLDFNFDFDFDFDLNLNSKNNSNNSLNNTTNNNKLNNTTNNLNSNNTTNNLNSNNTTNNNSLNNIINNLNSNNNNLLDFDFNSLFNNLFPNNNQNNNLINNQNNNKKEFYLKELLNSEHKDIYLSLMIITPSLLLILIIVVVIYFKKLNKKKI